MLLMPQDDYYLWHCEWCDSINRTLWTRIESNTLVCAACHKTFPAYPEAEPAAVRAHTHRHPHPGQYQLI